MGLGSLVLLDTTIQAFESALQRVVAALPFPSPLSPMVKISVLSLLHLCFACRVAGYGNLTPIWEAVARGKGRTEGLDTLNQDLTRVLLSCHWVFEGRAHFSA